LNTQLIDKLDTISARCKTLADMHSNSDNDQYSVSHPQMKQLYNDIAELSNAIVYVLTTKVIPHQHD
jgi:hypothetical protein